MDIKYIRENKKEAEEAISKRGLKLDLDHLLKIDDERKKLLLEVEALRHEKKSAANKKDKKKGTEIKEKLSKKEDALRAVDQELTSYVEEVPNYLSKKVPNGKGEEDNVEVRKWGKLPQFDFKPRDHLKLGENLGILDQKRAAKTSGHGFYFLVGDGAKLEMALVNWVVDLLGKAGYTFVIPPALVRKKFTQGTGYLPRREKPDVYKVEREDLYLIATSEIPIAGYHADEIFNQNDLPKNYVGLSPSFRQEAGSYGKYTHGIFRVHQFDKAEIFKFVKPQDSDKAFEEIISLQEKIYQALETPYRIVNICSGEMSAPAYLKYDLEYWDPVNKTYRELTSTSNTTDYQARKLEIKYKDGQETNYVHTLNGTAIALSRTIIAILENHQQKDGSVKLPKVLHEYLGKDTLQGSK
jgi:seryl-tRNA synthetase